jgi:bifunctional non-homologous end joining protein LigD
MQSGRRMQSADLISHLLAIGVMSGCGRSHAKDWVSLIRLSGFALSVSWNRCPSGPGWLHEIKHDGFRLLAQRSVDRVRLYTRNGHNWTTRYPLIARAVELLALRSCLIDGEVIVCNGNGLADFDLLCGRPHDGEATLCAFDLLELNGRDLR